MTNVLIKALNSAREGITISDAKQPENPLLYVNDGFEKMTGYTSDEILGRNCRFLQGELTNRRAVLLIKEAIKEKVPVQVELLNYTKDKVPFWNRLSITPVMDESGDVTHFIGVQDDITELKKQQEHDRKFFSDQLILETTIATQERERNEFGKEMHDNVNQLLATASLYLGLAKDQEDMRLQMISKAREVVQQTIEEIRKLSKSLVSPKLHKSSLSESLNELIEVQQSLAPYQITLQMNEFNEMELSDTKKLMIYRIVQEQLNNISKHASANNINILLENIEDDAHLSIKDDGVGFDSTQLSKGIGLQNIQNRLDATNGSLMIHSAPGMGCKLTARFPIADR